MLRYLEYAIIALSYIVIAKKVGPAEYGKTIPGFIFLTYSQYLMMGLNQALIKAYVVDSDLEIKQTYVKNTLYYIAGISLIVFIVGLVVLPKQLFVVSLISSMIYFQSIFQTLLRLENKIFGINLSNLIFSVIYFVSIFFYASSVKMFFFYWLVSLVISNVINGVQAYPILVKLKLRFQKKDIKNIIGTIKPQLQSGIKMTLIGLVSTYFLTYDRFLLNYFSNNKALNGNYQLSDNIASTIYLFIGTMLFYYTPVILKRASLNSKYRLEILKYGVVFIAAISMLAVIVTPLLNILVLKFFPAYSGLTHFLIYQFILKIVVLSAGISSNIAIALNLEVKYLKWWFVVILLTAVLLAAIYKFTHTSIDHLIIIALIFQVMVMLLANAAFLLLNRRRFFAAEHDEPMALAVGTDEY